MKRIVWLCTAILTPSVALAQGAEMRRDYPIRPVPFTSVRVDGGFWLPRLEANRSVTIPLALQKCEETGRIANFKRAARLEQGPFQGIRFDDSDVYKVLEGVGYCLALQPDSALEARADEIIGYIAAAQEPDGYLYTTRTIDPAHPAPYAGEERWSFLEQSHELYNVGHLYEAAVAYYLATGKRQLLDVALKNADLILRTFGPQGRHDVPGHQEIEIGLCKLYRLTGEEKYLQLAKFFLDQRGRPEGHKLYGPYSQDHKPVVEQEEAVGHAVRACYMYSAMADVAALTGDPAYLRALDRLWEDVVGRKLAITGGVGARSEGEAFGKAYELPNKEAYNETCAAIANALWNHRMFLLHGDAKYIDVLERILYNGILSGVSLKGDLFFYPNPLASEGGYARSPWFACACCPTNLVRFLPSIPGFAYATTDSALYMNLFHQGHAKVEIAGTSVELRQMTQYPWEGEVELAVEPAEPRRFVLKVRIPGWARGVPVPSDLYRYLDPSPATVEVRVNGQKVPVDKTDKGYLPIERTWARGDRVQIRFSLPIRRVVAHPNVEADRGLVALERGPVVYCLEEVDNPAGVFSIVLSDKSKLVAHYEPSLLGGVVVISGPALREKPGRKGGYEPCTLRAIPYFAWANRGADAMTVWIKRLESK
jgi:hypothetical protein